ncbi:universal stress protein [Nocardioides glacieisoli]|uniref:Universal stress protein n=2 Tax=Nocardioides glacieisoli TaxID=1168730 RepID=A0A4Q2RI59_9ACTN|nr:universal stress protein [Nocardioides glacieisoli]
MMSTEDNAPAHPRPGSVVVGVTGPGRERAALRFAADCARREGRDVVLVHAFHPGHPAPPPGILLSYADASEAGDWVVKEVGDEFRELSDGSIQFTSLAVAGAPWRVLGDLAVDARMLVVQHRHAHGLARLVTGHTVTGVASRAGCPVVSVNEDWEPPDAGGEVVVGVHEDGGPSEALAEAFVWAEATGAPVRVVHGWRLDAVYDDIITSRIAAEWRAEQRTVLTEAVSTLRSRHPGVSVEVEVRHQWPADVLVDDSRVARLVVMGRHGRAPWGPHHLGSIARTVLRESRCPVMVVPVHVARAELEWDLTADEVSPQT